MGENDLHIVREVVPCALGELEILVVMCVADGTPPSLSDLPINKIRQQVRNVYCPFLRILVAII